MDTNKTNNDEDLIRRQKEWDEMIEEHREYIDHNNICPAPSSYEINKRRYEDHGSTHTERPCIRVNNRGANALLEDSDTTAPNPNGNKNEDE